ncbi:hypothetical protein ON010_g15858 [Phytophthora cinnamomi]|nr:hypothetical protein ON010_g15858 [Phytophthora cinnamomi]
MICSKNLCDYLVIALNWSGVRLLKLFADMATEQDAEDLATQVKTVKDNVIGEKTVRMYTRGIYRYVACLYENQRSVLCDGFIDALRAGALENADLGIAILFICALTNYHLIYYELEDFLWRL